VTHPLHLEQQRHGERPPQDGDGDAIAALAKDDARVLERLPPSTFAANVKAAAKGSRGEHEVGPGRFRRALLATPAVAAAAAVLVVALPEPAADVDGIAAVDRLKGAGAPALEVFVDAPAGPQALADGAAVRAGDTLQLRLLARGAAHGVVVSLDGRGAVTRHFPDGTSTLLPAGSSPLPFSFELDDAPGFERFFLVTSDKPLDVVAVEQAAKALALTKTPEAAPLSVPRGAVVGEVLLRKAAP